MTQPAAEQLLNLADRAEKGLSPDEAQRLRDGLNELLLVARMQNGMYRSAEDDVTTLHNRAVRAEAAIERVHAELALVAAAGLRVISTASICAALGPQEPQP